MDPFIPKGDILNADALKKPRGQFTVESFWGPSWGGLLRSNIPFNCAQGQILNIISVKGQSNETINILGRAAENGYIVLKTDDVSKALQGFIVVFTLT